MESFGARFPRIYTDSSFKGWFVSTLLLGMLSVLISPSTNNIDALLAAWFGSLINGPIADRLGRKLSINLAVVIFVIGSAIQCGAVTIPMLFAGMFQHLQDTSEYLIACRESYRRSGGWSVDHGGAFVHFRGMHPHLTEEGEEKIANDWQVSIAEIRGSLVVIQQRTSVHRYSLRSSADLTSLYNHWYSGQLLDQLWHKLHRRVSLRPGCSFQQWLQI
jgi:hypothetical protein